MVTSVFSPASNLSEPHDDQMTKTRGDWLAFQQPLPQSLVRTTTLDSSTPIIKPPSIHHPTLLHPFDTLPNTPTTHNPRPLIQIQNPSANSRITQIMLPPSNQTHHTQIRTLRCRDNPPILSRLFPDFEEGNRIACFV